MESNIYNLTNPQKSIWLTEQFYQGSCVNNLCGTVAIDQVVDFDMLKKAIYQFVKDNDSFRLMLMFDEKGEIKQEIINKVNENKKENIVVDISNTRLRLIGKFGQPERV